MKTEPNADMRTGFISATRHNATFDAPESEAPWETRPTTAVGMLDSLRSLLAWEEEHGRKRPYAWGIVPTERAFVDMLERLLALEEGTL